MTLHKMLVAIGGVSSLFMMGIQATNWWKNITTGKEPTGTYGTTGAVTTNPATTSATSTPATAITTTECERKITETTEANK
jgi:hypothetical protein